MKSNKILVQQTEISIRQHEKKDFISLTDIARAKNADEPKDVVKNWLRSKTTIEFLGLWERINNPNFKGVEFDSFKNEAGSNLESINAEFIKRSLPQSERIIALNETAISQIKSLINNSIIKKLK